MSFIQTQPKSLKYGIIQRGTSLTIPIQIKKPDETPVDLTGTKIYFTVKSSTYDFEHRDARAYVVKEVTPAEPLTGKTAIKLSSLETYFDPGEYYFDIEIVHEASGAVSRLCTLQFTLVGGPTNRTIREQDGQFIVGNEISILTLAEGNPITLITPPTITSVLDPEAKQNIEDIKTANLEQSADVEKLKLAFQNLEREYQALKTKVEELETQIP